MPKVSISQQRIVYIVTHKGADSTKFPTRKSIADAVVKLLAIEHWAVSLKAQLDKNT